MRQSLRLLAPVLMVLLSACGGSLWVQKGDALLSEKRYDEAVEAYERALRESPSDEAAQTGIANARREQALEIIIRAERELDEGRFVAAMREALRARAMPLDLDDVSLTRRIDRAIERISDNSDDQVQRSLEEERYLDAVLLAEQLLSVDESRRDWAQSVRRRAVDYYRLLAGRAREADHPGSAALRYAIARDIGGDVAREVVEEAWAEFREPNCFANPELTLKTPGRVDEDVVQRIRTVVDDELRALQSRCGVGGRPLEALLQIDEAQSRNLEEQVQAAAPLPGVSLETEEVYYEEIPYTEVEEVTTYETRVETIEHRDCAPRPGQRGCRTWTEEVERKVPVVERREVQKTRRSERRRPVKKALPDDQVVRYEKTVVTRSVRYRGTLAVSGRAYPFEVYEESVDTAHDAVRERGVNLPEDPLRVRSLEEVQAEADALLALEIRRALQKAVAARAAELDALGAEYARKGDRSAAEEAYLAKLVIGGEVSRAMERFFDRDYGRSVPEVMRALLVVLGRAPAIEEREEPGLFPSDVDEGPLPVAPEPVGSSAPAVELPAESDDKSPVVPKN